MTTTTLDLPDAEATAELGRALARALHGQAGAVIYLHGDLGAGKTTLARALLRELGVEGSIRSPTYTLMEPYRLKRGEALHLDLYRLNDPRELLNLGLDDYPTNASLWLVEWPERGANFLPPSQVSVRLTTQGAARRVELAWPAAWGAAPGIEDVVQKRP